MSIKPSILPLVALSSVVLFSFRETTPVNRQPATVHQITLATNNPLKTDTGGRAVNLDSAQACIDRFAALMKDHGFADQAGLPIDIHLTTTSMITTGENFDGKNLLNWLTAVSKQYKAANKKMMIKIAMGVYDTDYLNTYDPNNAAANNRIAVFLIPYDAGSGKAVKNLIAVPNGSGGTQQGGSGYDLGGVQP
jgi:hypothetical protein